MLLIVDFATSLVPGPPIQHYVYLVDTMMYVCMGTLTAKMRGSESGQDDKQH